MTEQTPEFSLDWPHGWRTRSGKEVRIYAHDGHGTFPIHGARKETCGWVVDNWTRSGQNFIGPASPDNDIVNAPGPLAREIRWFPAPLGIAGYSDIEKIDGFDKVVEITFEDGVPVHADLVRVDELMKERGR